MCAILLLGLVLAVVGIGFWGVGISLLVSLEAAQYTSSNLVATQISLAFLIGAVFLVAALSMFVVGFFEQSLRRDYKHD